ncbi:MAG: nucleoside kinase [Oscillospiraceae bacterium]|nr:nucleoside kinase [Oscillospiraceae bacterium]
MPYPYSLEEINQRAKFDAEGFVQECEAIYSRKVLEAAAMIKDNSGRCNVVFLSGPSGSGKTTTALKISSALESIGIHATTVSLDKYYKPYDPETSPHLENGEVDLESPYCLDLELLNEHFHALKNGDEVLIPHYSFKLRARDLSKEKPLRLGPGKIVIFEGIHALNDMLCGEHPEAFKIYISAHSDIEKNGALLFKRAWTRLLRRVVRDERFRDTDALETLKLWINVQHGEMQYITPYKHKANLLFDSTMPYEIPVMKRFALRAFSDVQDGAAIFDELATLLPALNAFEEVDPGLVPPDSVIREFIGGGIFKY